MNKKYFLFVGLMLVLVSLLLKGIRVEQFYYLLMAGIGLKVFYLILGLLDQTLAGGRFLVLFITGVVLVVAAFFLKQSLLLPELVFWIMGVGFALKACSIVMMVVVGRKRARVLSVSPPSSVK